MTIHQLEPKIFHTTFGRNEPALRARSGDTLIAETRDARGRDLRGEPLPDSNKPPADGFEYSTSNPLVGPVYVEGAEPGDVLAVSVRHDGRTRKVNLKVQELPTSRAEKVSVLGDMQLDDSPLLVLDLGDLDGLRVVDERLRDVLDQLPGCHVVSYFAAGRTPAPRNSRSTVSEGVAPWLIQRVAFSASTWKSTGSVRGL